MEEPDFWNDPERSTKLMKEAKNLKDTVEGFRKLESDYEEIGLLIEMGNEENDASVIPEIEEMLKTFEEKLESLRISTLLSGQYDSANAILRLNAGAGGTESCDWCGMLYRMYCRWADSKGFSTEVLDYLDGACTLEDAIYKIKRDTRHFAKRQITWFKREKHVTWINKKDYNYDEDKILEVMLESIKKDILEEQSC